MGHSGHSHRPTSNPQTSHVPSKSSGPASSARLILCGIVALVFPGRSWIVPTSPFPARGPGTPWTMIYCCPASTWPQCWLRRLPQSLPPVHPSRCQSHAFQCRQAIVDRRWVGPDDACQVSTVYLTGLPLQCSQRVRPHTIKFDGASAFASRTRPVIILAHLTSLSTLTW